LCSAHPVLGELRACSSCRFENEFHWSRATISFAIGINLLVYGLVGPFAVAAMDRFGVRRTMGGEA
jgi:hypothetical protein